MPVRTRWPLYLLVVACVLGPAVDVAVAQDGGYTGLVNVYIRGRFGSNAYAYRNAAGAWTTSGQHFGLLVRLAEPSTADGTNYAMTSRVTMPVVWDADRQEWKGSAPLVAYGVTDDGRTAWSTAHVEATLFVTITLEGDPGLGVIETATVGASFGSVYVADQSYSAGGFPGVINGSVTDGNYLAPSTVAVAPLLSYSLRAPATGEADGPAYDDLIFESDYAQQLEAAAGQYGQLPETYLPRVDESSITENSVDEADQRFTFDVPEAEQVSSFTFTAGGDPFTVNMGQVTASGSQIKPVVTPIALALVTISGATMVLAELRRR